MQSGAEGLSGGVGSGVGSEVRSSGTTMDRNNQPDHTGSLGLPQLKLTGSRRQALRRSNSQASRDRNKILCKVIVFSVFQVWKWSMPGSSHSTRPPPAAWAMRANTNSPSVPNGVLYVCATTTCTTMGTTTEPVSLVGRCIG